MKKISVVIATRGNEKLLGWTIKNIRAKIGTPVEVVVVFDGTEPDMNINADQVIRTKTVRGPGYCRDKGIAAAASDLIFICDAHMDFEDGFGRVIVKHHKQNRQDVCCGTSSALHDRDGVMALDDAVSTAARFCFRSEEPGGERWVMSGKWAEQKPGEIGCVYGACYSFTRQWYRKIGEPLRVLDGWGMDEEYLSAGSWLMGGRCVLLPYHTGHVYYGGEPNPAYQPTPGDAMRRFLNRWRFAEILPATKAEWEDMHGWLGMNVVAMMDSFPTNAQYDISRAEVVSLRQHWAAGDWQRVLPWIDRAERPRIIHKSETAQPQTGAIHAPAPVRAAPEIPRLQVFDRKQCPECSGVDTFRVYRTVQVPCGINQYGYCAGCGLRGTVIKSGREERLHWGHGKKDLAKI
jgi:hypothetical protein